MTNSTKLIGLIMTVALWAGVVVGQGVPTSDWGDELPSDISLPSSQQMMGGAPMMTGPAPIDYGTVESTESLPSPYSYAPTSDGYGVGVDCEQPDGGGFWHGAAPIESTGTWLERGFWYCEADAVIFNRMWNRYDLRLAAEDINVNTPPINNQSVGFNPIFLNTNRLLIINGSLPGRDAAVRTTLGHFMFRDSRNRDHTVEFTGFGAGEWEQNRVITSEAPFGLFVPFVIDGGNISFDGSSRQTVDYSSHYKSFETNYRVKQRLGHDQLIMDPNGGWHRAAHAEFEREYLAGLRYMKLEDRFDWNAQDIGAEGDDGRYLINTDNDLFGFQLGGGTSYKASRWSVGLFGKGGVYLNDALGNTQLTFTDEDLDDSNLRLRENQLSFVGEFKLQGRFHVTPNVSLRGAYELMYLTAVAQAPAQATFIPEFSYLNTTGDPFYHGFSFGLEGYW
jgi:Putative beta barrel porin-7 (BBP7)